MVVRVEPPHGTRARYNHRAYACRCEACKAANNRYMALYRSSGATGMTWRQLSVYEALEAERG